MTKTPNILSLDTDHLETHDVALAAFKDNLVFDYNNIPGEDSYRLVHPVNHDESIVFSLETTWVPGDGDDLVEVVDGWTYSTYDRSADGAWYNRSTDGYGDSDTRAVLDNIADTLSEWSNHATP